MGLSLEEFEEASRRKGPPCSVATVLEALGPQDRAVLEQALAAPVAKVGHSTIERVLKDKGYQIGTGQVGKHRRKDCRCGA